MLLMSDVTLQFHTFDQWRWMLETSGVYPVRSAYHMLTADDSHDVDAVSDLIWHIHVIEKVFILSWRLLRGRLPTKANLVARGILSREAQMCVTGCGEVETAHHLFFSCTIFRDSWHLVHDWIGVCGVDPYDNADHFLQLTYLSGESAARRSFMQLMWFLCV